MFPKHGHSQYIFGISRNSCRWMRGETVVVSSFVFGFNVIFVLLLVQDFTFKVFHASFICFFDVFVVQQRASKPVASSSPLFFCVRRSAKSITLGDKRLLIKKGDFELEASQKMHQNIENLSLSFTRLSQKSEAFTFKNCFCVL